MIVVLLGPPGTGKGTQARLVADRLHIAHVSTGDMFREAAANGTELGKQAKAYMDQGDLVPDEVAISMLSERMLKPDAARGVVFDGYPRTRTQAEALDAALAAQGKTVDIALHLTAPDDELVRRLNGRWTCPNCGEIYHDTSRPPRRPGVCDACGSTLAQREDDKAEVVRQRLDKQRPPVDLLEHYRLQRKLIDINGGQDVQAVGEHLLSAIERATREPAKG